MRHRTRWKKTYRPLLRNNGSGPEDGYTAAESRAGWFVEYRTQIAPARPVERYQSRNGNSGVLAYEIRKDAIAVKIKTEFFRIISKIENVPPEEFVRILCQVTAELLAPTALAIVTGGTFLTTLPAKVLGVFKRIFKNFERVTAALEKVEAIHETVLNPRVTKFFESHFVEGVRKVSELHEKTLGRAKIFSEGADEAVHAAGMAR